MKNQSLLLHESQDCLDHQIGVSPDAFTHICLAVLTQWLKSYIHSNKPTDEKLRIRGFQIVYMPPWRMIGTMGGKAE